MDEITPDNNGFSQALAKLSQRYLHDEKVRWLPVRHHSPACAHFALAQLNAWQPDVVLIEAPHSFGQHLGLLQNKQVVPPIAVYQQQSYFPFAENSPEWQALRWAGDNHVPVQFIDLDSTDEQQEEPLDRYSDARILSSSYSRQLQQTMGCRDADELWLRLFELQNFANADDFFEQVLLFCGASRLYYDQKSLQQLGDLDREKQMRACIRAASHDYQRIAVMTGGFHTSALFDYEQESTSIRKSTEDSFVIRYSDSLLDAHQGYQAGMPYPAFCRWLFEQRSLSASDWLLYLLAQMPKLTLIAKQNIFEHLSQLSQLRGIVRAGCYDLLDSLGSCQFKQQSSSRDYRPWQQLLRGENMGQLPANQRNLPLVDDVLAHCKHVQLTIGTVNRSHFSLYELTERQRQRRQLLSQLLFLDIGFCQYEQSMHAFYNIHTAAKHESWRYHWTPSVEVALIELSTLGGTLKTVVQHRLAQQSESDLPQMLDKLILSLQLGVQYQFNSVAITREINDCSTIKILSDSFIKLYRTSKHPLFNDYHQQLDALITPLWRQLSFHLPSLNQLPEDEALQVLLSLQAIARQQMEVLKQPWRERLRWLIEHNEHTPTLWFALKALAVDLDELDPASLLNELQRYSGDRFTILRTLLTVVPHWLNHQNGLLSLLNHSIEQLDDEQFVEQLPQLRGLFCDKDAREIDGISQQLGTLNQWQQQLNWLNEDISEHDVNQAMLLDKQLQQQLLEQGLSAWTTR